MIILTKHCTVRLDRIPKLDELNILGPIYINNIKNDAIDNNTVVANLLTNVSIKFEMSNERKKKFNFVSPFPPFDRY